MSRELKGLKAELESGVKRIKMMANSLESGDLSRLSSQLQRIIEFTAEVAKLIDDCEILQREFEAKKAVSFLVEAGFSFQSIEIDGMRFDITDDNEMFIYNADDDIRR